MNYDETALNLINEWENGEYLNDCQKKAKLQWLIVDALKSAAFSDSGQSAGSVSRWIERFETASNYALKTGETEAFDTIMRLNRDETLEIIELLKQNKPNESQGE